MDALRSAPMRPLIYAAFASIFVYALYFDVAFQPRLGHSWYLYKAVMLTNINLIIITIYSVLQFVNCLVANKWLQGHLDFAFFTSIYPISFCTVVIFWGLYAFDPDFVMPEWIRNLIPEWLNQVTHTLPLIYTTTDAVLTRHRSPSWLVLFAMSTVLTFAYWGVVFFVRFFEGYWIYPIFDLLNMEWWCVVLVLVVFLYLFDIACGLFTTFVAWGKQPDEPAPKKLKKK